MSKPIKKTIISTIIICIAGVLVYVTHGIVQMYKINEWQSGIGKELPMKFKEELPLQRDTRGLFYITGKVGSQKRNFILDTQARSMAKTENLISLHADYWGVYPKAVKNLYGQKEKYNMYTLDNVVIADKLPLHKPLFSAINKTNALYDLLDKDLLGKDILQHFVWKFSLDSDVLTLFSNSDAKMLGEEVRNYTKIENGLDDGVPVTFESEKESDKYHFDLGYQGYISIDKELYEQLKQKYPQKEYIIKRKENSADTTFMLTNVPVRIKDLVIPNCKVTYRQGFDMKLLGVGFIERFNFILGYEKRENIVTENLYLQPRKTVSKSNDFVYCPSKGFDVEYTDNAIIVSMLEVNGEAHRKGLRIGDKILDIDNGVVSLNANSFKNGLVSTYIRKKGAIRLRVERSGKKIDLKI